MNKKNKLKVYITHDTEDVELVKLFINVLDYMGIFEVYLSPFDMPGVKPQLDSEKMNRILNCDILIALFTRRSQRSILIKSEIRLGEMNKKIIIPLAENYPGVPKISQIAGSFRVIHFQRNKIKRVMRDIFSYILLSQSKLGVSDDLLASGAKALEECERQKFVSIFEGSGIETIQKIVFQTLKKFGYSVKVLLYFLPSSTGFDLTAKKVGKYIGINCYPREIDGSDVAKVARYTGLAKERWIICTGFTEYAANLARKEGIKIVFINELFDKLNPIDRDSLRQKFTQLMCFKAGSVANYDVYPQLKVSLEACASAKTSAEKGKSLEILAECFIKLFPKLEVAKRNVKIENEELDIVVKNENEKIFWQRLGTPIIIECKNWIKPVGAPEVRNLIQKMREVKTAFLIVACGITSENGAQYEIIEARKNMKFILVFDLKDIEWILKGANPEEIVAERFYALWTQ
jgi:hypothetical protein